MKKSSGGCNICVVGTGYVGLVTGTCLAELGHHVVCVDSDPRKLKSLKAGSVPIYEPGLEELFHKNIKAGRLHFASAVSEGMEFKGRRARVIFIAVGTPPRPDGSADLSAVENVACEVAKKLSDYTVVVDKSTVPVETGEWVSRTIARFNKKGVPYDVVSNPEFLSEGTAVQDFLHPDRVVLGVTSARAEKAMREIYAPLKAPILVTDVKSAELIKHASNSFLATKISYINAVSVLCEKVGADVGLIAQGMGMDRRIGPMFLKAGLGYGGFCLHPAEPVVLRDPAGVVRTLPISEAHKLIGPGQGRWEALSLDPKTNRMEFMPVNAVSRRPYRGLMVRVATKMGKSVRATADHPFLVKSQVGWDVRLAADLTTDDWLPNYLSTSSPIEAVQIRSAMKANDSMTAAKTGKRLEVLEVEQAAGGFQQISSEVAVVRVTGVERRRYHGPVYSLEVEGNETFACASGLVVHNCFPKDLEAFHWISKQKGYDFALLKTVKDINEFQKTWVMRKIEEKLWNLEGKTVALLGLAFKPNTDDMRFAPSVDIVTALKSRRVSLRAFDPVSMDRARELAEMRSVKFCKDPYDCVTGADALAIVTEWPAFKALDLKKVAGLMRNPLLLDGRNLYDPKAARRAGFEYASVGRP